MSTRSLALIFFGLFVLCVVVLIAVASLKAECLHVVLPVLRVVGPAALSSAMLCTYLVLTKR